MNRSQRVRYEMLLRVRDFGATYADRFPESSGAARAFAEVARLTAMIQEMDAKRIVAVREGQRARVDQRKLMLNRMKAIVRTSRAIRSATGSRLRLAMPNRRSDTTMVLAARAFLHETEPYQDQLEGFGLPAAYLTELRSTADVFEAALKARRAGRSGVAFARAAITAALGEGADLARTLDVIVHNLIGHDPAAMAAWTRDRRLVTWRGDAPATVATEPASAGGPAPVAVPAPPTVEPLRRAS